MIVVLLDEDGAGVCPALLVDDGGGLLIVTFGDVVETGVCVPAHTKYPITATTSTAIRMPIIVPVATPESVDEPGAVLIIKSSAKTGVFSLPFVLKDLPPAVRHETYATDSANPERFLLPPVSVPTKHVHRRKELPCRKDERIHQLLSLRDCQLRPMYFDPSYTGKDKCPT